MRYSEDDSQRVFARSVIALPFKYEIVVDGKNLGSVVMREDAVLGRHHVALRDGAYCNGRLTANGLHGRDCSCLSSERASR